jgi:hypothetical protein
MAKRNDDIGDLFKLPLTEFIGARKELAARFKKGGLVTEAEQVKALAKPPISAWTANQLYWRYRDAFDELLATGQRFRKAQTSGKIVNMREALDARREALLQLSDLATEILRDAGHNPSLDTLRRINTTLEALSAFASSADGPTPGRLTQDVDPPGFDSFGSFTPASTLSSTPAKRAAEQPQVKPSSKSVTVSAKTKEKTTATARAARDEERQTRLNTAKASLQEARSRLTAARATAKSLEAAQKRAEALKKEAEKEKRQAEERLKKASAAFTEAAQRAQSIASELTDATKALDIAQHSVENATRELETAFRESKNK